MLVVDFLLTYYLPTSDKSTGTPECDINSTGTPECDIDSTGTLLLTYYLPT